MTLESDAKFNEIKLNCALTNNEELGTFLSKHLKVSKLGL